MSVMRRAGLVLAALVAASGGQVVRAQAVPAVPPAERTIRVAGTGEVRVSPDQAQVSLAVETFAATAREAGQQNAQAMQRLLSALTAAGVPRDSVETRGYSLFPEHVHSGREEAPRIRGYRAVNQVVVTTGRLERVGNLIDVALQAGANRLEGVSFSLRDAEAAHNRALAEAVRRARARAEVMASALGVRLGPVLDASTSVVPARPFPVMLRRDMAMAESAAMAPTPIQPGEQTVQATASLVFAIAGR